MRGPALLALLTACGFEPPRPAGPADPTDGPPWWDERFAFRRQLVVRAAAAAPGEYSVSFIEDGAALVAAAGVRPDGNDWRIVRHEPGGAIELDRWIDDGDGTGLDRMEVRTWFRLPVPLAAGGQDDLTYVYHGAPEAGPAPAVLDRVFVFGDDFETDGVWSLNDRGERTRSTTELPRAGARALEIEAGGTSAGGVHRDIALAIEPLLFSHYLRQSQTNASFGHLRTFRTQFAARAPGWNEVAVEGFAELDSDGDLEVNGMGVHAWHPVFGVGVWRHVEILHDIAASTMRGRIDGGAWSVPRPDYRAGSAPLASIALEGEGQDGSFQVDNYIIRRFVEPEPEITKGSVEERRR